MIRIEAIVWGVRDVPRTVKFWCQALDYEPMEYPDGNRFCVVQK